MRHSQPPPHPHNKELPSPSPHATLGKPRSRKSQDNHILALSQSEIIFLLKSLKPTQPYRERNLESKLSVTLQNILFLTKKRSLSSGLQLQLKVTGAPNTSELGWLHRWSWASKAPHRPPGSLARPRPPGQLLHTSSPEGESEHAGPLAPSSPCTKDSPRRQGLEKQAQLCSQGTYAQTTIIISA